MFWLWLSSAVVAMLGVLLAGKLGELPVLSTAPMLTGILLGALLLVAILLYLMQKSKMAPLLKGAMQLSLLVASTALFAGRAYVAYQHYTSQTIAIPVQVQALVHIDKLSDSLYGAAGAAYRQQAVISDIRTLGEGHTILPETMTVLLEAYPPPSTHTDNKPKPRPADSLAVLADLQVGDRAVMTLRLSPISPSNTATGFDSYRWLVSRHIHAKAQVLAVGELIHDEDAGLFGRIGIEKLRQYYRQLFYRQWQSQPTSAQQQATAIALSLLTGDRSLLDKETKQLYQHAGISHLLAISGAHVLFLAIIMAALASLVVNRFYPALYYYLPRWQLRFWVMLAAGGLYALFTGFEVPAVRTVIMLLAMGAARYLLVGVSSFKILAMTALLMVFVDPYVLWQAGFWLSFIAVALLMAYESKQARLTIKEQGWQLLRLQSYVFFTMLPVSLFLFGKVALWGLLVNLFAVGLFGWVIVPLIVLGAAVDAPLPWLGQLLWQMATALLSGLHKLLHVLPLDAGGQLNRPISLAVVLLFGLAFLALRLPWAPKRLALLPMFVAFCALMVDPLQDDTGDVRIYLLASDKSSLSQMLIVAGDARWLVLSSQPMHKPLDGQMLGDALGRQLGKLGIAKLSGVIVQNHSDELLKAAAQLTKFLTISELWWAGGANKVGALVGQNCHADKSVPVADGQLRIITRWQGVDASEMMVCNVWLDVPRPVRILGDVLAMDGKQLAFDAPRTQVVIDGSSRDRLWQLYHLLCHHAPDKPPAPTLFLTHSKSQLSAQSLANLGHPMVLFSNHLQTHQQRQQAQAYYQELSNTESFAANQSAQ